MEPSKRSLLEDPAIKDAGPIAEQEASTSSPAPKKQKVDTEKPNAPAAETVAAVAPGKPKEDTATDQRVINVPVFENNMQFPDQLWELLQHDELKEAIWWLPGDDAFAINEPVFSELLLESHFRGNRFTSIIRKLNRWGYRKFVDRSLPPKTVSYYHRSFQKSRPDLLKSIEKEEGKPVQPSGNEGSYFSPFPEATASHSMLAQMLPQNQPHRGLLGLGGIDAFDSASAGLTAGGSMMGSFQPSIGGFAGNTRMHTLGPSRNAATLGTPLDQRQQSNILQSIFGQRGVAALPSNPMITGLTAPPPSSLTVSNLRAPLATDRSRDFLRSRARDHTLPPRHTVATDAAADRQALLASMVSNIERERQQEQNDERYRQLIAARQYRRATGEEQKQETDDAPMFSLLSGSRAQTMLEMRHHEQRRQLLQQELLERRMSQEQKQDTDMISQAREGGSNAMDLFSALSNRGTEEANLLSVMTNNQQRSFFQLQLQMQHERRQQEPGSLAAREEALRSTQLLEAERQHRQRADLGNQLQLRMQLQAAISSPNPLLASPLHQPGLTRRIPGQDVLAISGDLLTSPEERVREQLRLLQRQQMEEALQRGASGGHPSPR